MRSQGVCAGGWHGGVVVVVVVESSPSSISLCGSKKPISMAYYPATDPIRSDPRRSSFSFRFLSLRLHSPALLLLFGSILTPGGRAHAQLAARTVAQHQQQPRQTHLLHTRAYMQHATVGTPQKHLACCELSTLCCSVVLQRND